MTFPSPSVCREFSAENINRVINHPAVRPWVGAPAGQYVDVSPLVANLSNFLLMGQGGGVLFQCIEPGLYEAHTQFLPEFRGKGAVAVVNDALRYMFTRTDAVEIVTKVPAGNVGALGLVRAIHGQKLFDREKAWLTADGLVDVSYYSLTIMAWVGKAEGLAQSGEWFHGKLEAAKSETAGAAPLHEDDATHDQYVGATVEMIAAGQVNKGVAFYSRWAKISGYGPIAVIATNPVVIDIGDAILAVRDDDFDILLCR